jgi:hypothetical protein
LISAMTMGDRRAGRVDGRAQGAVSVAVRRRDLHQGHVEGDSTRREQFGNVGQEDGHEIGAPFFDGLAQGRPREERRRKEPPLVSWIGERRGPLQVQVIDLHPLEVGACREGIDQGQGVAAAP